MKKFIAIPLSILATAIFFTGCGQAGDGDITEETTTTTIQSDSEETTKQGIIDEGEDKLEEGMDNAESKMSDIIE